MPKLSCLLLKTTVTAFSLILFIGIATAQDYPLVFVSDLSSSATTPFQDKPADQKVIKDPAEFNAYIAALNTTDPVKKAGAFEAFIAQYPNSVMRIEALEQAMGAYQQAGDPTRLENAAKRICEIDGGNVRALAIVTYLSRGRATQGDAQALAQTREYAERGLRALQEWRKPDGISSSDFEQLYNQMCGIFYGASGFAALQAKDYPLARHYYLKSVQIDPSNLQDNFQLATAALEMHPVDVAGFWYIARAVGLAEATNNAHMKQSIVSYGKARYSFYHGSDDGWEKLVEEAKSKPLPPEGFSVTAAKTSK